MRPKSAGIHTGVVQRVVGLNSIKYRVQKETFKLQALRSRRLRCSGEGEMAADVMSKGDWEWERAWQLILFKRIDPETIPRVLL